MQNDFPNPHDRFFKKLFSQLDTATDFARYYLPEHLVAAIGLTTLETEQMENLIAGLR